jgi:sulfate-transporting ATPase
VATIPLGILFALPAVRTRGINLAIVTLGLGSSIELVLFDNQNLTGGILGTQVPPPSLFGLNINSAAHPTRYGLFALGCLVVVSLLVANVRRGRIGRRLVAVRTNERAAAALGISVSGAKLYAFGLAGALAALGGILVAFTSTSITYPNFTNFTSIQDVALAILGGIGYLAGPVIGGTLAVGGMNQQILQTISGSLGKYVPLIGGISVILIVLLNQNGIARESIAQIAWVRGKLAKRLRVLGPRQPKEVKLPAHETVTRVAESTLEVRGITVRYGGTTAVNDVSLTVKPGQIVGLIGPNGAGKTSLVDAVTGFAKPTAGTLLLDGRDIGRLSPVRRARVGIGRSFQSLELFEDISVFDNLRAASDPRDFRSYLRDLIWPVAPPIPGQVVSAINEFRLGDDLNRPVENLPYGQRRLLAIARAVATGPSILLLDEPAAGLGSLESSELASLVRRLASEWGIGILLVEHDMDFVMSICDELVVLDFGRKIAEGTPDVVRSDPAVIAAYLGEEEPDADGADKRAPAATVHSGETEPAL